MKIIVVKTLVIAQWLLFGIGFFLLILNISGFFLSMRNKNIYNEVTNHGNKFSMSEKQFYKAIKRGSESDEDYVIKVNNAVSESIANYWSDEGITKYNLRVPAFENYLLFLASFINPHDYKKYQFCNYKKAVERGVGLCSQKAIVVSEILRENGFDSKILGLDGHVVATVKFADGKEWVVGPDYGVVIKQDIGTIEKNPEIVREYYEEKYKNTETLDLMVKFFGKEGNRVFNRAAEYCNYDNENLSYKLIWLIPIVFMAPFFIRYYIVRWGKHNPKKTN